MTAIAKGVGTGTETEDIEKANEFETASPMARDLPQYLQGVIGTPVEKHIGKGID